MLSQDEQAQVDAMARSRSSPAALVVRARIVLAAAAGEPNSLVADRVQLERARVGKWRRRLKFVKDFFLVSSQHSGRSAGIHSIMRLHYGGNRSIRYEPLFEREHF